MAGKPYTEEFNRFWKKYPARWNANFQGGSYVKRRKRPAFEKWQKLSQAIRNECFAKVHLVKQYEGGSVRDCVTWLNQWGWEDIELEEPKPIVSAEQANRMLKQVPQGDKRSKSDIVNENISKLKG